MALNLGIIVPQKSLRVGKVGLPPLFNHAISELLTPMRTNHISISILILSLSVVVFAVQLTSAQGHNSTKVGGDKAAEMDGIFREYDRPDAPGASVIVISRGKVLFKKSYGLADPDKKTKSTTQTNYRLASCTKQFTAMAIMILAARNKLSYDSRLTDFFPDFPRYGKEVTVRHLLNHTSGVIAYEDVMPDSTTIPLTDNDVLRMMSQQDHTYFPSGTQYRYSNSGYVLLGLIVEKASGISFPEFLQKNIFKPLRMNHTVLYHRDDHTDRRRAYGYSQQGDAFVNTDESLTSSTLGDGRVYSSVDDLYKWDQALYSTRLVSAQTLEQAFTPSAKVDETSGYGFGWFIDNKRGPRVIWHSGNTSGFTSRIHRVPEQKFSIIVLTNRSNAPLEDLVNQIHALYLPASN
jgi:CubicO group peptidase (beta-lactamase class C family)